MNDASKYLKPVSQATLKDTISYIGRRLHTGRKVTMRLRRSDEHPGTFLYGPTCPLAKEIFSHLSS